MKNVILSKDTYSWIRHTAGLILQNPKDYAVFVLYKDNKLLTGNKNWCEDAVYIQKKHDLVTIGEKLCLKRLYNFNCIKSNSLDFERMITQLSLYFVLNNTKRVYCPDDSVLRRIVHNINKNIEIWTYNKKTFTSKCEQIRLNTELHKCKLSIKQYITCGTKDDLDISTRIETFYKEE